MTYTENGSMAVAEVVESNARLNGSVCKIASLEVYRGSSQAVEISHSGFTLNESGNIVVSDLAQMYPANQSSTNLQNNSSLS